MHDEQRAQACLVKQPSRCAADDQLGGCVLTNRYPQPEAVVAACQSVTMHAVCFLVVGALCAAGRLTAFYGVHYQR